MPLQDGAHMAQRLDFRFREIALLGQRPVQGGGRVPLREHKTIPGLPFGIHLHLLEIQIRQRVRNGQGAAGMSAFRVERPFNHIHADAGRRNRQLLFARSLHLILPFLTPLWYEPPTTARRPVPPSGAPRAAVSLLYHGRRKKNRGAPADFPPPNASAVGKNE